MRTLVLVVLGGALLYFAWSSFKSDEPTPEEVSEESTEEPGPGQLMSVSGPEEVVGGGADEVSTPPPAEPVERPATEPPSTEVEEFAEAPTLSAIDSDPLDLAALGNPLREGSLLLHDPDGVPAYLKGEGAELSANRKQLLMAYALLVSGRNGLVPKYSKGLEESDDVTGEEYELLASALAGQTPRARNASAQLRQNPLALGVTMALMAREGRADLKVQRCQEAAECFSELIQAELEAPWKAERATLRDWSERLHEAQASHRWRRDGSWPAIEVEVEDGDTLIAIRKRVIAENPGMNLCTGLIERANQLGKYLRKGQLLRIPTEAPHVVIDLSAKWLLYYHGEEVVAAWEVTIGTPDTPTTPGHYTVGEKIPEPMWFPPGRASVPFGDPRNPLGTRWITLAGSDGLGIHGTWEPENLGQAASDGCIRLRNDQVELLYEILPRDSEVIVLP